MASFNLECSLVTKERVFGVVSKSSHSTLTVSVLSHTVPSIVDHDYIKPAVLWGALGKEICKLYGC